MYVTHTFMKGWEDMAHLIDEVDVHNVFLKIDIALFDYLYKLMHWLCRNHFDGAFYSWRVRNFFWEQQKYRGVNKCFRFELDDFFNCWIWV